MAVDRAPEHESIDAGCCPYCGCSFRQPSDVLTHCCAAMQEAEDVDRAPSGAGQSEEGVTLYRWVGDGLPPGPWNMLVPDEWLPEDGTFEQAEFVPAASLAGVRRDTIREVVEALQKREGADNWGGQSARFIEREFGAALSTPEPGTEE